VNTPHQNGISSLPSSYQKYSGARPKSKEALFYIPGRKANKNQKSTKDKEKQPKKVRANATLTPGEGTEGGTNSGTDCMQPKPRMKRIKKTKT